MRRVYNILLCLAVALLTAACNRPRIIPEKELGQIFHDALLVNAYIQHNRAKMDKLDSMNIYEPVLAQYGYTPEDMQYTINDLSRRKSASLAKVADHMFTLLEQESEVHNAKIAKIDTIERVARRRYEKVVLHDTAIVAKTEADTSKLQIYIRNINKGGYRIEVDYTLDKEDKGIGRRYSARWMCGDSLIREITSSSISYRPNSKFQFDTWLTERDSLADRLLIDFTRFNLRKNRLPKTLLTINEIKVIHTPTNDDCLKQLFNEQSHMRIFADTMINLNLE